MKKPSTLTVIIAVLILFVFCQASQGRVSVKEMKVEYTTTPLGIDVKSPLFSWQIHADANERGISQSAYQVVVKDPSGKIVWDSGKKNTSGSLAILYAGEPLGAATRYDWTVTVWDQGGKSMSESSWFETGLMDPSQSAWSGAQWIGGGDQDLVFQPHYLTVFRVGYTIKLDQKSKTTRASFILGANDSRLLDKNKNIFNIQSARDQSYIKFELDISSVDASGLGLAQLNVYRAGYHPDDSASRPLFVAAIPQNLINNENKYAPHTFWLESVFGTTTVYVDSKDLDHKLTPVRTVKTPSGGRAGFNLNPVGQGGDYISFPLLADIGFSMDPGQKAEFSDVEVTNLRQPSNSLFREDPDADYDGIYSGFTGSGLSISNGKYLIEGGKEGVFFVADPSRNSMPMLRTEFSTSGKVSSARLYVTARGIYEIQINGTKVGDDYFNPGLTQYNKTHMYQAFDVTPFIVSGGSNAIGAWLGEGWWSGNITFTGSNWNYFGDRQSLLAKLVIRMEDGTETVITTNDRDWKYFGDGPLVYGSFFQGEMYDAEKESSIKGWTTAGFNDKSWKKAVEIPLDGTAFQGEMQGFGGTKTSLMFEKVDLIGQVGENAGVVRELVAKGVEEVRPGVFVYDMGQNMVGIPQIKVSGLTPGTKITLRFAEVRYPARAEYGENAGMIMIENIRAALTQDIYIAKGGDETIQPRFTFHGYRFLEITGMDRAIPAASVKGLVISSAHELSADYETSDPKVNRLWQNIIWSTLGNFLSIPTDCPQRNERMGWSGDLSVFSRTSTYVLNANQFLKRHLMGMRDVQSSEGRFTDVAPLGGGFGGLLWGSAGMTVPWEIYLQYGDTVVLSGHYDAMKAYMDYLANTINAETGLTSESRLGDWLGPQNNQVGTPLIVTAYHVFDLDIMRRVAGILGRTDDVAKYSKIYEERKHFFNKTFVNDEKKTLQGPGGKISDTQTSYAVGLALGAFNEENIPYMIKNLAESVRRENTDDGGTLRPSFSLMTGFIGTAWISSALSQNGFSDLAYLLLLNDKYPSWLYAIDQGATTIWERLNGYTVENGFGGNNSMNSFNHYSFGAVGQWMMANSLGIQRDVPGFNRFVLAPEPDPSGKMIFAKGHYDSMYGTITSNWESKGNTLIYKATVPANTIARLVLPAIMEKSITEGGKPVRRAKGVTFEKMENGKAYYELRSGTYEFESVFQ
jgi:alpha-L-rhamnosidase